MRTDLLSRRLRSLIEDALADWTLREIDTLFQDEGFAPDEALVVENLGQRRSLVRRYHADIDFSDPQQASRALRIYRYVLTPIPAGALRDNVSLALRQDGVDIDADRWTLPDTSMPSILKPLAETAARIDASTIARQIELLTETTMTDPRLAIGTAKELLETTCRTILGDNGIDAPRSWDVQDLLKATLGSLALLPTDVPDDRKGAETIRKILRTLTTTVQTLAELRNAYGSGHGPDGRHKGLQPRHAQLAVGAAATVATFLFETQAEQALTSTT